MPEVGRLAEREREDMATNAVLDRWSLSGRTALVTGGTKGIGYVSHAHRLVYVL